MLVDAKQPQKTGMGDEDNDEVVVFDLTPAQPQVLNPNPNNKSNSSTIPTLTITTAPLSLSPKQIMKLVKWWLFVSLDCKQC